MGIDLGDYCFQVRQFLWSWAMIGQILSRDGTHRHKQAQHQNHQRCWLVLGSRDEDGSLLDYELLVAKTITQQFRYHSDLSRTSKDPIRVLLNPIKIYPTGWAQDPYQWSQSLLPSPWASQDPLQASNVLLTPHATVAQYAFAPGATSTTMSWNSGLWPGNGEARKMPEKLKIRKDPWKRLGEICLFLKRFLVSMWLV